MLVYFKACHCKQATVQSAQQCPFLVTQWLAHQQLLSCSWCQRSIPLFLYQQSFLSLVSFQTTEGSCCLPGLHSGCDLHLLLSWVSWGSCCTAFTCLGSSAYLKQASETGLILVTYLLLTALCVCTSLAGMLRGIIVKLWKIQAARRCCGFSPWPLCVVGKRRKAEVEAAGLIDILGGAGKREQASWTSHQLSHSPSRAPAVIWTFDFHFAALLGFLPLDTQGWLKPTWCSDLLFSYFFFQLGSP